MAQKLRGSLDTRDLPRAKYLAFKQVCSIKQFQVKENMIYLILNFLMVFHIFESNTANEAETELQTD